MQNSKILKQGKESNDTVYDISLDGTFVDAFTGFVCHNTNMHGTKDEVQRAHEILKEGR